MNNAAQMRGWWGLRATSGMIGCAMIAFAAGLTGVSVERASASFSAPSIAASCFSEPDARFEIESLLRDMAATCLAGDGDGYMQYISQRDEEFVAEQRYFANELKKKPPVSCAMTVVGELKDVPPGKGEEGAKSGQLKIEWMLSKEVDPKQRERSISFDALFVKADGVWKYAGETWEVHEAGGVKVLHDPGLEELAARAAASFNEVRAHVEEGFMLTETEQPKRTQQIKLYGTMKHLQASIALSYVDALSGWNEPGEPIKILTNPRSGPNQLRPLLAHEYGHVTTFLLGDQSNKMPWWILEGVAELAAEKWGRKPDGMVKAWAAAGKLAPWEEITDFETVKPQWRGHVYTQGHHMMAFITAGWGREGRVKWMTAMAKGGTIEEATQQVMGMSFKKLDEQWRASIKPEGVKEESGGEGK